MKKIIIKIFIFIIILLVLDRVLFMGISVLYKKSDLTSLGKILKKKYDIIYLGDSQSLHGIIPSIVKNESGLSGYNASMDGSGIVFAKGFESIILSHYYPKAFVLQVMPLKEERGAISKLAPYFTNSEVRQLISYYPISIRVRYSFFKSSCYNSLLLFIIKRLLIKHGSNDGYRPLYGVKTGDSLVREEAKIAFKNGEYVLKAFIEKARKNHIEVIIIKMPTLEQEKNYCYDTYSDFAKIYNIPLIDFSVKDNKHMRWAKEYFYDDYHLNNKGATAFSLVLGEEINTLRKNNKMTCPQ
ncbi:MAG: hypothetical protein HQ575_06995 [Candidatus Omnitrophica bacterium]|nr:hypothetical protein [Candidatus Omnitrophota bacterium]